MNMMVMTVIGIVRNAMNRIIILFIKVNYGYILSLAPFPGIAAVNIGGRTLHSFAGIQLGQGTLLS